MSHGHGCATPAITLMDKSPQTPAPAAAVDVGSGPLLGVCYEIARFPGGWNYRGYCVYRKCKGNAGCLWQMADDCGEWAWFFRTLAEFRRTCDRWERQRAKEATSPNAELSNDRERKTKI